MPESKLFQINSVIAFVCLKERVGGGRGGGGVVIITSTFVN